MAIMDVYNRLKKYQKVMRFNSPATEIDVKAYEISSGKRVPRELKELFMLFDGGEIFTPGTKIYGLGSQNKKTLSNVNRDDRKNFSIPNNYLIFAKLNFGDFICINTEAPFDVIQWDHESDEEYLKWSSISSWLQEAIEDYARDGGGQE